MKSHFIVGDVHGCLNTLKKLLKKWKPKEQQLIFVGDIVGHGNYIPQTAAYIKDLQKKHKHTILIRGNHEEQFQHHCLQKFNEDWYQKSGEKTFSQYLLANRVIDKDAEWFAATPVFYETPRILVSHAGVCDTEDPYDPCNMDCVIWHRNDIKRLDQIQIYGHSPKEDAMFDETTNSINIDTGAYKGNKLTALIIQKDGYIIDIISEKTHEEDVPVENEELIF